MVKGAIDPEFSENVIIIGYLASRSSMFEITVPSI
jgi:hypothetical protein